MRRKTKPIVPLASRLRAAIATPRIPRGTVTQAVKEVATTIPLVPLAPGERHHGGKTSNKTSSKASNKASNKAWPVRSNRSVQLGLMLAAAGLVGLTAARRHRHAHRADA